MHAVREATRDDLEPIGRTLAHAFSDDPVWRHLVPTDRAFHKSAARQFSTDAANHMRPGRGLVTVSPGAEGVAIWAAPSSWRPTIGDLARVMPAAMRLFGPRLPLALRTLAVVEKVHPREPHWYLAVLGTDPDHQGHGFGSAVMKPQLRRCDLDGIPAYLESSKEQNISFYVRHGFEVRDPVPLPGDGPSIWPMWRDPRPIGDPE